MDLGLAGKNAIVTGGSLGIGKAIALELAREGVNVTIAARMRACPSGHWFRPRRGVPATTSGWSADRSWLMKKLSLKFGRVALWTVECRCMLSFTARYPMLFSLIFRARFTSLGVA